ncbi:Imm1 family immunity protein [Saccharopolyspora sp. NPDC047091]|uniref:Imm1 family immunity protein n=1 Tax=Saccharopolyspora sp. NPDC047091 TaxID=3155924 RepID=UPI003409B13F
MEELLEDGGTQVSDLEETPEEVAEVLRRADHERTQQMWSFYTDIDNTTAPTLKVGLNGERGALIYWDGKTAHLPADGSNPEPADYWWADHHAPFPRFSEIPAEAALQVTREFLRTGQRPTCIEWAAR